MSKTIEQIAGVEVGVETGVGRIQKIERRDRNARVEIAASHLKMPVTGWADLDDIDLVTMLDETGPVEYRIEIHRSGDAPRDLSIAELQNFQKFRRLVKLHTGVPERRVDNEPPPQPGPKSNQPTATPPAPPSGGHVTDTYPYSASLGLVELAFELLHQFGQPITPKSISELAQRLLAVANDGQLTVRGTVDLAANSHMRARGAIRSAIVRYPPPFSDESDIAMDNWQHKLSRAVGMLMGVGLELLEATREPS